jgi:glycosyltransferase involved in cell wall biosynthesis
MLSILIPTFNDVCVSLVHSLSQQAQQLSQLDYEIVVADDGSTQADVLEDNRQLASEEHCRYIERGKNAGRSAIRNFLAQEAKGEWLLFIDADMQVLNPAYLQSYSNASTDWEGIIYGGYEVADGSKDNLRFRYEKAAEPFHTVARRREQPYHDFHTSNFMIRRELMLAHPFDIRIRKYGYEDVLFGKEMQQMGIPIKHIDAPVVFNRFESNELFVQKTEEGLQTLRAFSDDLLGYSRLLDAVRKLQRFGLCPFIRLMHRLFGPSVRRNLCSRHPSLFLFKAYKLGYFLSLRTTQDS